jgi:hypothetical protein
VQGARTEKTASFQFSRETPPYLPQYVALKSMPNHPFTLSFQAPPTTQIYAMPYTGGFWWSNRGDLSDARLIRTVDLTRVKHATLHYRLWYAVEHDYDYGYIEASTDGGKTWTTLKATHTTRANPFGANYGNGYTGQSKKWDDETVDLSPYAGKKIRIRFEYITDDSVNFQGMAIRDISIPQIGYKDDGSRTSAPGLAGWTPQGFVDVEANHVANPWTVQLIEYTTHGPQVVRMPLTEMDHGSMRITPGQKGIKRIVVVVSSAAPKTTAQARFTLTAHS